MPAARLRIDFGPGRAIGPGKVELIEQMRKTPTISGAARALGMSYRRAWLLVRSLNATFAEPVVLLAKGGPGGGGSATVTPQGDAVVRAFRRAEKQAQLAAAKCFAGIELGPATPASRSRVHRLSAI
jgi:molybdate transport system regulatory protein